MKLEVETIRDLIRALIEGLNKELRAPGDTRKAPRLALGWVMTSVVNRAGKSRQDLEKSLSQEMLDCVTDTVTQFALREYGAVIAVPGGPASVGTLGMTIVNAVLSCQGMDITPRSFLREPANVKRLRRLVVVAGMTCLLHEDMKNAEGMTTDDEPSASELAEMTCGELMGIIMASEEMSLMYARARINLNERSFAAFYERLKAEFIALEGRLTPRGLRLMLSAAEHATVVAEAQAAEHTLWGGTSHGGSA